MSTLQNLKNIVVFFKATLTEEAMISMFLNNARKSLKVHAVGIKRSKPLWDTFLREITLLINQEPREVGGSQVPWKRPSLAVEVDKYGVHCERKRQLRK